MAMFHWMLLKVIFPKADEAAPPGTADEFRNAPC
jgi:hypothetical protein